MPNTINIHGRQQPARVSATLEAAKRFSGRVTIVTLDRTRAAYVQAQARADGLDHVTAISVDDASTRTGLGSVVIEPNVAKCLPATANAILDRAQAERRAKRPPLPKPTRPRVYTHRTDLRPVAYVLAAIITLSIVLAGVLL